MYRCPVHNKPTVNLSPVALSDFERDRRNGCSNIVYNGKVKFWKLKSCIVNNRIINYRNQLNNLT